MSRACRLRFIPPQLPSLTEHPPEGADWIHEVKHDGYRTMLLVERGNAVAYTRNGHDWSDLYRGIIAAARKLPCRSAILDGEVIVQDARGISDFEALQAALRSQAASLIFYAFDLLHLGGKDLRETPLIERRAKLQKLLGINPSSPLQFSEEFVGDAAAFFRACAAHELEGIVSKLATSRYRSGRSKTWLKTKCFTESELTLLGIDRDRKTGAQRALLAKSERGQLVYAGPAFIALRGEPREDFEARVAKLKQERPVFSWLRNRDARCVKPAVKLKGEAPRLWHWLIAARHGKSLGAIERSSTCNSFAATPSPSSPRGQLLAISSPPGAAASNAGNQAFALCACVPWLSRRPSVIAPAPRSPPGR